MTERRQMVNWRLIVGQLRLIAQKGVVVNFSPLGEVINSPQR
ncbi:hypothetical protein FHS77_001197 [Paenochrobactrum gallinarii]|uniref:Uncharacterized protein n=1 Tax=Paenochrobactrum gallinarii TaxID=643673 RepID=A0A841LRG6_9HYPH|nr:hypothetical protein [Paenochrobactrum gallinarii]